MAKTNIWMPFYVADYLADTLTLSTEEHGAYLLLIFAYWNNRGPLKDDNIELARITRLMRHAWLTHRPRIAKFFRVEGGFWHHSRIDYEIARAIKNSGSRSSAAKKAAKARYSRCVTHASRTTDACAAHASHSHSHIDKEKKGVEVFDSLAAAEVESKCDKRPNSPYLAFAQAEFARVNERCKAEPGFAKYTADEVRQAWLWFEGNKDAETGEWLQPSTATRKPIGNWLAALMGQIGHMRNVYANSKRNTATGTGTPRGEDTRDHASGF